MTQQIEITLTWTPLVRGLVELLARSEQLTTRDTAATELRTLLAAAGATTSEAERLLVALAANPGDPSLLERLHVAARSVDAQIAAGGAR